ncbi:hypothetical protein [Streptomyces erythrochromogenes]|uniref:hypothetical protein n=1 Tax=Streptomyces erythrochromogenes TaxID=285574 RepID=UPI0036FD0640
MPERLRARNNHKETPMFYKVEKSRHVTFTEIRQLGDLLLRIHERHGVYVPGRPMGPAVRVDLADLGGASLYVDMWVCSDTFTEALTGAPLNTWLIVRHPRRDLFIVTESVR